MMLLVGVCFCSKMHVSHVKINFSDITAYDLDNGYKVADFNIVSPVTIDAENLDQWNIYIQPHQTNLFYQNQSIAIADLQWKKSSDPTYKSISIEKTLVASSGASTLPIQLTFRIKLDWNTYPGNYSVPLEISIEEKPSYLKKQKKTRRITNN